MQPTQVKALIEQALDDAQVFVNGEGCHLEVVVVSQSFIDCSRVQRQRLVYGSLGSSFASGEMHALAMKTYTPDEWEQLRG